MSKNSFLDVSKPRTVLKRPDVRKSRFWSVPVFKRLIHEGSTSQFQKIPVFENLVLWRFETNPVLKYRFQNALSFKPSLTPSLVHVHFVHGLISAVECNAIVFPLWTQSFASLHFDKSSFGYRSQSIRGFLELLENILVSLESWWRENFESGFKFEIGWKWRELHPF